METTQTEGGGLEGMSEEVLLYVFSFLRPSDLIAIGASSTRFHRIAGNLRMFS
jgi:hypothetical protein